MPYLHAVRVQFSWRTNTAGILNFNETSSQCLELVIDREQRLRDWFGGHHEEINVRITTSDKVQ